jgi:hypothetical protein
MPHGSELKHIQDRTNLPTDMTSKAISRTISPKIRAQSFFSARVAEANILSRFREITDSYMTGRIGRDEARNLMLEYARANNRDDGTRAITNLASSARLNLIIDQNASMARAVGDYERMYSPANKKVFPYVIYHASVGSRKPRSEHQRYDGMIFEKDDPWLKTHWPPWDFNCHCRLENCTDKKAHKTPDLIQPPTPADKVTIDSKSGFSFDPAHAFEKFDYSAIKDPDLQDKAKTGVEKILTEPEPAPAPIREPKDKEPVQEPKPIEGRENIPENMPKPESVKEPEKEMANTKPEQEIKQENSNEVNQPGALDIKKNDRYETPGIDMQSPDPFPNDDKHKKLRPVYNVIKNGSEDDFIATITPKGVNMRREFIGIYDAAGRPFWIGMGPKNVGAANFPEIPKGCTFIHNHPNGSTFSVADIRAFIENEMTRMVVSIQSKDSTGKQVFHKYTLTKKDSGVKLPLEEIKQRYEKEFHNKTAFEAWKAALNGSCYEIEFS